MKRRVFKSVIAVVLVASLLLFGVRLALTPQGKLSAMAGQTAEASTTIDQTCDGAQDDIQWLAALNTLPPTGGTIQAQTFTYVFALNVTSATPNVTIIGTGAGTYVTRDGINPAITAGGNNWTFRDIKFDVAPNMGATTGWSW